MTDDLIKRLLDWSEHDEGKINDARQKAADCIEQLVWGRDKFEALAIMNLQENGTHIRRAEAAEAKLAKAVEVILLARVHVANNEQGWSVGRASARLDLETVNAVLAELEKKE